MYKDKARQKAWQQANPDKVREHSRRYRARKRADALAARIAAEFFRVPASKVKHLSTNDYKPIPVPEDATHRLLANVQLGRKLFHRGNFLTGKEVSPLGLRALIEIGWVRALMSQEMNYAVL